MAATLPAPRNKNGRLSPNRVVHGPIKPYYMGDFDLKTPEVTYYEADGSSSVSSSTTSSAPTSPEIAYTSFSFPSSEPTMITLDSCEEDNDDGMVFPAYDTEDYFKQGKELEPPVSVVSHIQSTVSPASPATPTLPGNKQSDKSKIPKTAGDDNSIEIEPTAQVDYLTHKWKDEEIWASWRYVTSKKDRFKDPIRLENASWRAWSKYKDNLKIISPERLRWRKDCDVTWLYGPLQTGHKQTSSPDFSQPSSPTHISTSSSFLKKKPILKKKSASETILQRSLSTHTLLKHAGAIVRAQEVRNSRNRALLAKSASELAVPLARNDLGSSYLPTGTTAPGIASPGEEKRIHFNDEVSQCIAVEAKHWEERDGYQSDDDEPSDDGLVTMKKLPSRTPISPRSTTRNRSSSRSRTIAPLPSTTLKYRDHEPILRPSQFSFRSLASNLSSNINSTIPPNISSAVSVTSSISSCPRSDSSTPPSPQLPEQSDNFLLDDEDDDVDNDDDNYGNNQNTFGFNWNLPRISSEPPLGGAWFVNPNDTIEEDDGLFFPNPADSGLLDRVADTVNTARDIAHVIWNVGWRP